MASMPRRSMMSSRTGIGGLCACARERCIQRPCQAAPYLMPSSRRAQTGQAPTHKVQQVQDDAQNFGKGQLRPMAAVAQDPMLDGMETKTNEPKTQPRDAWLTILTQGTRQCPAYHHIRADRGWRRASSGCNANRVFGHLVDPGGWQVSHAG